MDSVVINDDPQCPFVISIGMSLKFPAQCGQDADSANPETTAV